MLTMQQLEESKIYQREGVSFKHPIELSQKFIDIFGEPNLIKVDKEVTNINDDGTKNIAYGRVLLQSVIGKDDEFNPTVGMIISYDTMQMKLFAGVNVSACTNLCVFNATWLQSFKYGTRLEDRLGLLESVYEKSLHYDDQIREMKLSQLHRDSVHKLHSQMVLEHRKSKDKAMFGETYVNKAFADMLLLDSRSEYAIGDKDFTTEWNVYNALTQQISNNKDVLYMPDKSLEIFNLIKDLTVN